MTTHHHTQDWTRHSIPCSLLVSSLAAAEKGSKGDGSVVLAEEELPCPGGVAPDGPGGGAPPPEFAPPMAELDLESLGSPGGTV